MKQSHTLNRTLPLALCFAVFLIALSQAQASSVIEKVGRTAGNALKGGVAGTVAEALYQVAANEPCRSGVRRVVVVEEDVWGLRTSHVREMYVRCEENREKLSDQELIEHYQITSNASQKLRALLAESEEDSQILVRKYGLSQKDLDLMTYYRLPTGRGIHLISKALELKPKDTKRVLRKILEDAKVLNRMKAEESKKENS